MWGSQPTSKSSHIAGIERSLEAYASLIGNPTVLRQALPSLGIHSMLSASSLSLISVNSCMSLLSSTSFVDSSTSTLLADDFWATWPWRRLTEWNGAGQTEFSGFTIPSLLLEYEQQVADPVSDLTTSDDWCQRALNVLASSYVRILREERRRDSSL